MTFGNPISPKSLFWLIVVILLVGGAFTLRALSVGSIGANESLLLSILLTIFSIGAGWLISHTLYQDTRSGQILEIRQEYERNVEVYAVKASEKVINLSNQIGRVIEYLDESPTVEQDFENLKARHNAAIHMLGTLKSINDTSLSDWEGVIGERLDAKRKIDQQRDYDINAILEEIRGISEEINGATQGSHVTDLVRELKRVSSIEASLPPPRNKVSFKEAPCPSCSEQVKLKTNRKGKVAKTAVTCTNCNTSLAIIGGGISSPKLERRHLKPESIECPECGELNAILLDNAAPSQTKFTCIDCDTPLVAQRLHVGGVKTKIDDPQSQHTKQIGGNPDPINADFVAQVEMLLPPQPWPTGVHKEIAEKLEIAPSRVSRAIGRLIKTKKVHNQINGQIVDDDIAPN